MPTNRKVKNEISRLLAGFQGTIFELGSGWGGILNVIAKENRYCQIRGYELSPIPWLFSTMVMRIRRHRQVRVYCRDFFNMSFNEADLIYCYLYPKAMIKLKLKFEKELKDGCIIISNAFQIPGWKPIKKISYNGIWGTELFIYEKTGR